MANESQSKPIPGRYVASDDTLSTTEAPPEEDIPSEGHPTDTAGKSAIIQTARELPSTQLRLRRKGIGEKE